MFCRENLEFGVGVEKSEISVLVSAENGAGVNKMTNITYESDDSIHAEDEGYEGKYRKEEGC